MRGRQEKCEKGQEGVGEPVVLYGSLYFTWMVLSNVGGSGNKMRGYWRREGARSIHKIHNGQFGESVYTCMVCYVYDSLHL